MKNHSEAWTPRSIERTNTNKQKKTVQCEIRNAPHFIVTHSSSQPLFGLYCFVSIATEYEWKMKQTKIKPYGITVRIGCELAEQYRNFVFDFFFLFANSILDTIDHVLCARARDRAIDARREWCWNKFHFNHIRKNAHRTSNRQTFCFNMINVPWPFAFVSMMDERLERKVAKSFWKWNSNSIEIEILTFEYALVCYAHKRGAFWRELSLRLHHYEDSSLKLETHAPFSFHIRRIHA